MSEGSGGGAARYETFLRTRRFASLDGLRAVAIAAVVWHHAAGIGGQFLGRSHGVTLFFILSGFLITTLLVRERRRTGGIDVQAFYLRRALRIFPLYYAMAAVYVVLVLALERRTPAGRQFLHNLPYYLTFTSDWFVDYTGGQRVIFYFAWSLAVQEQFYALWPWVMRHARSWRFPLAFATGLLAIGEGARWFTSSVGRAALGRTLRPLEAIAAPIFVGCILAVLVHTPRGFGALWRVAGRPWSMALALAVVAVPIWWPVAPMLVSIAGLALVVLVAVVEPDHSLRPFLQNPAVRWVGTVSFGIYLTHMLVLNVVRRAVPGHAGVVHFALVLLGSTAVASLSYVFLERPCLRLGRPSAPGIVPATVPVGVVSDA